MVRRAVRKNGLSREGSVGGTRRRVVLNRAPARTIDRVKSSRVPDRQVPLSSCYDPLFKCRRLGVKVADLVEQLPFQSSSVLANGGFIRDSRENFKAEELSSEDTEFEVPLLYPHDGIEGLLAFVGYSKVP